MSQQIAEMSIEVEQGGASIEPGDTRTGVIQGSEIKSFDYEGDEVSYYQLNILDEEADFEYSPDWPARITPGTGLGRLVQRFGAEIKVGASVDLHELFQVGQKVEFEVAEETFENDEGEEQSTIVVDEESVRPAGQDVPDHIEQQAAAQEQMDEEDDEGDDVREAVLRVVDDMEGSEDSEIKKALAKVDHDELGDASGGEYVKAYKSLKDDGDISDEDGLVFLNT